MNRRTFLAGAVGVLPVVIAKSNLGCVPQLTSAEPEISIKFDLSHTLALIPPDFVGLGYEISSVAREGLLSAQNLLYLQLVRTLGVHGSLRVGGNTSDYATYSATGRAVSTPENQGGSVVNDAVLRDLGGFLEATGWQLIWGLNLGSGKLENAILEARAVTATAKTHLLAFEIGNEPDLFARHELHRHVGYTYHDYLRQYREYRDSLRKEIPTLPLAGPDAAVATDWVTQFAADEGKDVKLLTHHYYREGQNPTSTIDKLLHTDPKLAPMLAKLKATSASSGVPYRICETNSFSGGGKPGVSDTLASSLWVLDFMFTLASAGCAGVNMETGVNQLGFISSYSPIADDEHGHYSPAPEYYGMLAFAQAGVGRMIETTVNSADEAIKAYAVERSNGHIAVTVINKRPQGDAAICLDNGEHISPKKTSLLRLLGPSLESKSSVTLGGARVSADGHWSPNRIEEASLIAGRLQINVPAASAAIINLHL
jgi:hypothetical protein